MTNEQARKLLGGYATNSLTEAERQALFEAALEDQELFDALQREEALKELLADPASRSQVQQALAQEPASRPAAAWSRWWTLGGVAGAVAAAVLIIAVIRPNQPPENRIASVAKSDSPEVAHPVVATPAPEPKPRLEPAPRKGARASRVLRQPPVSTTTGALENSVTVQPQAASPPPPPPAPATPAPMQAAEQLRLQQGIQSQAGAQQAPTFGQRQDAQDREKAAGAKSQFVVGALAGGGGSGDNAKGPLLRYSLVRRDASGAFSQLPAGVAPQSGDAVRLTVFPAVAGYLSLYQLDPAGDWKRLGPEAEQGLLVAANATQTIPDTPIEVKDTEQKLRLMLTPLATAQSDRTPTPLVTDITIAAGKLP